MVDEDYKAICDYYVITVGDDNYEYAAKEIEAFTQDELERMAKELGAEFEFFFAYPDGYKI